jgi:anti-sigma regulatory factor (Ser/Thr protein kinase)
MEKLTLEANIENLDTMLEFINTVIERADCPPSHQGRINVAADEIFMNIANYAYHPETGTVDVIVSADAGDIILRFEDSGKPFNPLNDAPEPDLDKPLMERDIGGLGIFMVKQMMDEVSYEYANNKNILTMCKKIQGE